MTGDKYTFGTCANCKRENVALKNGRCRKCNEHLDRMPTITFDDLMRIVEEQKP